MCCLAGRQGDDARALLGPNARLLSTFRAVSHFEAVTTYNQILGREAHTLDQPWDFQPYPAECFADNPEA